MFLQIIQTKYPFRPLKSASPALLLSFQEGIQLLNNDGIKADPKADLTNAHEKRLGEIVYEKYVYIANFCESKLVQLLAKPRLSLPS